MKRKVGFLVLLLLLGLTIITQAEPLDLFVSQATIGSGGVVDDGDYTLFSHMGQPISGRQSDGEYDLQWGFRLGAADSGPSVLYLPFITVP